MSGASSTWAERSVISSICIRLVSSSRRTLPAVHYSSCQMSLAVCMCTLRPHLLTRCTCVFGVLTHCKWPARLTCLSAQNAYQVLTHDS